MTHLTNLTSYADAQPALWKKAQWALFCGNRKRLNITYVFMDRHPPDRRVIPIAFAIGSYHHFTFGEFAILGTSVLEPPVRGRQ